jgi:hypothetical protein
VHRPAKVGDLDLTVGADEEVLRLDVPVDGVLGVTVPQRIGDRVDVLCATLERAYGVSLLVRLFDKCVRVVLTSAAVFSSKRVFLLSTA